MTTTTPELQTLRSNADAALRSTKSLIAALEKSSTPSQHLLAQAEAMLIVTAAFLPRADVSLKACLAPLTAALRATLRRPARTATRSPGGGDARRQRLLAEARRLSDVALRQKTAEARTNPENRSVMDPFLGKSVNISDRLTDRLRGRYAVGPTMPNGEPEFGWRQHETPPVQKEAAARIDALETALGTAAADPGLSQATRRVVTVIL